MSQKLSKENALGILKSRKVLGQGSGYQVPARVTSVNTIPTDDGKSKIIVNLNLMTQYQMGEAKRLFGEGQYDAACNKHMSVNLLPTSKFIPLAGTDVMCTIGTYENKENITVQEVSRINPMPIGQTSTFSWEDEEETEAEETVEEAVTGKK